MALLVFAIIGGGIVFGLRYREQAKEAADARPSIVDFSSANIPEDVGTTTEGDSTDDAALADDASDTDAALARPDAPETIVVKVLNGGAAGGSAGKMVAYLRQNGYLKAEAGNANGSNAGVVVYYTAGMEDESKALQLVLLKEYKGIEAKPVEEAKIPEAKTAPMVVVLGS